MAGPSRKDLVEVTSAAAGKAAAALLEGSAAYMNQPKDGQIPVPPDAPSAQPSFRDDVERIIGSIPPEERASVHFHFKRRMSNGRGGSIMPNVGVWPAVGDDWYNSIQQEIAARYGEGEYIGTPKTSEGTPIKASPWVLRISEEFARASSFNAGKPVPPVKTEEQDNPVEVERKRQHLLKAQAETLQAQAAFEDIKEEIKNRRTKDVTTGDALQAKLEDNLRRMMEAEKQVAVGKAEFERDTARRDFDSLRAEIATIRNVPQQASLDETIDKITNRFAPAVAGFSALVQPLVAAFAQRLMAPPQQPDMAAILDKAFDKIEKLIKPTQPQTTKDRLEELNLLAQTAKALMPPTKNDGGLLERLEEFNTLKDLFGPAEKGDEPVVVQALRAAKEPIEALGKVLAQSGVLTNLQNRKIAMMRSAKSRQPEPSPSSTGTAAVTAGTPTAKEWGDLCKYISGCIDANEKPEAAAMVVAQRWPAAGAIVSGAGNIETIAAGIGQIMESLGSYAPLAMDLLSKIKSDAGKTWTQNLLTELSKLATTGRAK